MPQITQPHLIEPIHVKSGIAAEFIVLSVILLFVLGGALHIIGTQSSG